ncbi:Protein of unknown function [Natronoarchaeum philippinense]|uniref:DUF4013 domain-containing protein n=1 Tax=Natronoarchaeum philippinense TaxID=558529 RepID=A0A285NAM3_NATPI|nr:DUF4013 domain-containing protein [Natronoarchaeum philippinense]SNZ05977.1 Protein of unknown function [Natronoarchaeum philippinense]
MRMQEGLKYPFRADRPMDLFAVGVVLGLAVAVLARFAVALYPLVFWIPAVALAAVPAIALLGYLLRSFAATVEGDETPPSFGSPTEILKDGVRALVVSLVYLLVPLAIVLVTLVGAMGSPLSGESVPPGAVIGIYAAGTMTLVLVGLFCYAYLAAFGAAARGESLRAALDPRGRRRTLADARYFVGWAMASILVVTGWAAMLVAVNQNLLGLLAVVVAFYAHLAAARVGAEGYRRSLGLHRDSR